MDDLWIVVLAAWKVAHWLVPVLVATAVASRILGDRRLRATDG